MYELHNLSSLKCFIEDNLEPGEEYLCTLNGDFLSPSLLSSLDLGAAAVSVMNAVPITHACLGNHEFDHSIETLGQRLGELECAVINSNVFACPAGEEGSSSMAAAAALANPEGVPFPDMSRAGEGRNGKAEVASSTASVSAFLDHLPRSHTVRVGDVTVGLLGLCTTSTPLSSAKKPKGVVFADCVPMAKRAARELAPTVDAVVALTHQTLPEDARLAEEVPEIALILGGHEHTPFAGRMGHGANAAAVLRERSQGDVGAPASDGQTDVDSECVNEKAGTLCVKAGMDAENVVVVTIEAPDEETLGMDTGGRCNAEVAVAALAAADAEAEETAAKAAKAHHDDFGHGGLWSPEAEGKASGDHPMADDAALAQFGWGHHPPPSVAPGEQLGDEVSVKRPGSAIVISAKMYSLQGYRTDPDIDADIWQRSDVLRGLNQHTLSLHEHAERLGLLPLSSRDSRTMQCSLGTLFATIIRDECRADLCLYNIGGIRGNSFYGSDALTYGDLVAEVPFENNIVTVEMTGEEVAAAVHFSEAEQVRRSREGGSWGGYLQWDEGVTVIKQQRLQNSSEGLSHADDDDGFQWLLTTVKGAAFEPDKRYRVVTWAGLLDGADDIPVFRDIGRRIASEVHAPNATGAICFTDGIPFKILVMRHLCRFRWYELLSATTFAAMDEDGDGLVRAADVEKALRCHTSSASAEQEADAMVRTFDGDGDGALNQRDVNELMEHWGHDELHPVLPPAAKYSASIVSSTQNSAEEEEEEEDERLLYNALD